MENLSFEELVCLANEYRSNHVLNLDLKYSEYNSDNEYVQTIMDELIDILSEQDFMSPYYGMIQKHTNPPIHHLDAFIDDMERFLDNASINSEPVFTIYVDILTDFKEYVYFSTENFPGGYL